MEEEDCPICLVQLAEKRGVCVCCICDNSFCEECVRRHASLDNRCPLCRQEVREYQSTEGAAAVRSSDAVTDELLQALCLELASVEGDVVALTLEVAYGGFCTSAVLKHQQICWHKWRNSSKDEYVKVIMHAETDFRCVHELFSRPSLLRVWAQYIETDPYIQDPFEGVKWLPPCPTAHVTAPDTALQICNGLFDALRHELGAATLTHIEVEITVYLGNRFYWYADITSTNAFALDFDDDMTPGYNDEVYINIDGNVLNVYEVFQRPSLRAIWVLCAKAGVPVKWR